MDSSTSAEPVQSPCIGVCTMDTATGFCQGCFRTIEEIREWWDMSSEQQQQLMNVLEQRQAENLNFG